MPASICRRASRRTPLRRARRCGVNGVTSAVPQPVNACRIVSSVHHGVQDFQHSQPEHIPHREPALAALHPARGLERAARECRDRSRAVWVSVIVSPGASKPMVCVPGMSPARVDETSIARRSRARASPSRSSSAVPDGASRLAAWWASWIHAPKPRAAPAARAARSASARNRFTPSAKFGAATTPMPCASTLARGPPPRAPAIRSCRSRCRVPRRGERAAVRRHRVGRRRSRSRRPRRGHVAGSRHRSRRSDAGDLEPYPALSDSTSRAHPAVPDEQQPAMRAPVPSSCIRPPSRSTDVESRLVQLASSPPATSASRSTTVTFRRDAACETMRSGNPSSAAMTRTAIARIGAQAVADGAQDRHVAST